MTVAHIVLFEFKSMVDSDVIKDACTRMLALREKCVHPTTQAPYIQSGTGGKDNSIEGLQGGFSHAFVYHFASAEDRNYYVKDDPEHLAFVKSMAGIIQNVRVVDYEIGKL